MSKYEFTLPDGSTVTVEGDTTRTRAAAVALRDAGLTNAEVGEAIGTVLADGKTRTSGTAGNLIVEGLRDLGRESEVVGNGSAGGGNSRGKTAVRVTEADVLRDALAKAEAEAEGTEAEAFDAEAVLAAEAERLAKVAADAKARAKVLRDDAEVRAEFISEAEARHAERNAARAERASAEVARLKREIRKAEVVAAALAEFDAEAVA